MDQKNTAPDRRQKALIRARGLDPKNYTVVRQLNYSLVLRDRRDNSIKYIDKRK